MQLVTVGSAPKVIACSRRSDSLPSFFFFFVNFSLALYYLNAWNRLPESHSYWNNLRNKALFGCTQEPRASVIT